MKEFSLEEYLKNPDREVVTRDRRDARIICTDRKCKNPFDGPILALIDDKKTGSEPCYSYSSDGKAYENGESNIDLFFAPEKKVGWMNLYRKDFGLVQGDLVRNSEEAAKKIAAGDEDYITTIKVEWEEE